MSINVINIVLSETYTLNNVLLYYNFVEKVKNPRQCFMARLITEVTRGVVHNEHNILYKNCTQEAQLSLSRTHCTVLYKTAQLLSLIRS